MKKIKIYVLEGCDKCKKLKSTLDTINVKYDCITCENNPNACDKIEEITGVDMYPIVDLGKTILYIAEKYNDIGKKKEVNGYNTIGFYSIDNIIELIKKD